MKFYVIYKVTNTINGKYYIGKHITKNLKDSYLGSGKAIRSAIKKYGRDKFIKEIIQICNTEDEMNKIEEQLVDTNDAMSYNMTIGGKGGWHYANKNSLGNTPDAIESKTQTMKEYWTEERRKRKSEDMKAYNQLHGTKRYSSAMKNRHSDPIAKSKFNEKMTEVNKRLEKRQLASEKIKNKWKEPEFREKMNKRRHGSNSETMKAKWKDPVWKQSMLEKRRLKHEANKNN